jgi:light-regulated signal transduction histidine kinase (bacteriophytochrome)
MAKITHRLIVTLVVHWTPQSAPSSSQRLAGIDLNSLPTQRPVSSGFGYVISHDLQEPLRMVASYTQLLASRYNGKLDTDADEFIGFAVDGCNRMQGLIHDLLAYSRSGTDGKVLQKRSSENALNNALKNLSGTIEDSGAVVTHDALPFITTDEHSRFSR